MTATDSRPAEVPAATKRQLVTVIIPVIDAHFEKLGSAISSIREQQGLSPHTTVHIVVVDNSVSGLASSGEPDVDVVRVQSGTGAAAARNAGIAHALFTDSDFVAFLDADDRWFPEHLSCALRWLTGHPASLAFGPLTGTPGTWQLPAPAKVLPALAIGNFASTQTLVIPAAALGKVRFDASLPRLQDWDFVISLIQDANLTPTNIVGCGAQVSWGAESISRGTGSEDRYAIGLATVLHKQRAFFDNYPRALLSHARSLASCARRTRSVKPLIRVTGALLRAVARHPQRVFVATEPGVIW